MKTETNEQSKNLRLVMGAILATSAILIAGLFLGRFLFSGSFPEQKTTSETNETTSSDVQGIDSPGKIAIPGFESLTFLSGKRQQSVPLSNPETNNCGVVFTLMLPDETVLYKSGIISPGTTIEEVWLDILPDPGTYDGAILRYDCYAMDAQNSQLNGAQIKFTLEVK